ncbi:MAG: hypothetical protein V4773_15380 [Verrucomicrobiota bacterium]
MSLPTEPLAVSTRQEAGVKLFHAAGSPAKNLPSWSWLGRLAGLDTMVAPHWAPEGDPSLALRAREL